MQNTNAWAKAGIMFRETLAQNSKEASLVVTPSNGLVMVRRTSTGGSSDGVFVSGPTVPYYLKLIRNGSTFTAYRSSNGTSWNSVGSITISMASSIFVGMVVCAKANVLNTATFTNVTTSTSTSSTLPPSSGAALAGTSSTSLFNTSTQISAGTTSSAGDLVDSIATK